MTDEVRISVSGANEVKIVRVATAPMQAPAITRASLQALEAIPAGSFVNISSSGGAAKLQLADSTDDTKPADGYCPAAIASGNFGYVLFGRGLVIEGLTALTPGIDQWLGAAGQPTEVVPSTEGNLIQRLGKALTATTMLYTYERGTAL